MNAWITFTGEIVYIYFKCIERFIKPKVINFVVEDFESVDQQVSPNFVIKDVEELYFFIPSIEVLLYIERNPVISHGVRVVEFIKL